MKLVLLALMGLMLTVPAESVRAHGGGLDKLGCHHNRKAGGYHCHTQASFSPSIQLRTRWLSVAAALHLKAGRLRRLLPTTLCREPR